MPELVAGDSIVIGDRAFALSPLTLGALRKRNLIDSLRVVTQLTKDSLPSGAQLEAVINIVYASVSPGNPQLTRQEFDDAIDGFGFSKGMEVLLMAFKDVMVMSKFAPTGEGKLKLGEADSPRSSISPGSSD